MAICTNIARVPRARTASEAFCIRADRITIEIWSQARRDIAEKGIKLDRRKINLPDSIKDVGEHTIGIKLHSEVESSVKLIVTLEE